MPRVNKAEQRALKPVKPRPKPCGGNKKQYQIRYSKEVADALLLRLSMGEHLTAICTQADMPNRQTVYTWLREKPDFYEAFLIAKEGQADSYLDKMIAIATAVWEDHSLDAANARAAIDCLKFVIQKLAPKKYHDKYLGASEAVAQPIIVQYPPPAYFANEKSEVATVDE